ATHATKRGVRYRYYVSQPYLRGLATPPIGAIVRVPAPDIEAVVTKALREFLARSDTAAAQASSADQPNIRAMVARIEVRNSHLAVWLMHPSAEGADESTGPPAPIEENSPSSHLQISDGVRIQQRQLLGEALATTPFRRQERDFLPQRLRPEIGRVPV